MIISAIKKIYKLLDDPLYGEILMLHRVVEQRSMLEENRILEVTPIFLEQTILNYQDRGYRFASLDELQWQLEKRKRNRRKFVCFTLDDGFADNYDQAYPVFKKHNCPFAIYITTDFPDKKALYWWYLLEELLLKKDNISMNGIEYDCSNMEKKNKAFLKIRDHIFSSTADMTMTALKQLFKDNNCHTKVRALSWEQIVEMSNDPLCTIGAHSVTHASLPLLSDEKIRSELLEGKQKIEEKINKPVNHFAYPYGNYDEKVMRLVMEQFNTAVTTNAGSIIKGDHAYQLNRNVLFEII